MMTTSPPASFSNSQQTQMWGNTQKRLRNRGLCQLGDFCCCGMIFQKKIGSFWMSVLFFKSWKNHVFLGRFFVSQKILWFFGTSAKHRRCYQLWLGDDRPLVFISAWEEVVSKKVWKFSYKISRYYFSPNSKSPLPREECWWLATSRRGDALT